MGKAAWMEILGMIPGVLARDDASSCTGISFASERGSARVLFNSEDGRGPVPHRVL
jgi:hypothetical protein